MRSNTTSRHLKVKSAIYQTICILLLACQFSIHAQVIVEQGQSALFHLNRKGRLVYKKDSLGNRLPDFSHAGYHSGEKGIPDVPVKIILEPGRGDDTERIQAALDELGTLPADRDGFRGALLLRRGVYRVSGGLKISNSGIVLRGEGNGPDGTLIIATGYGDFKYKRTLITVGPLTDTLDSNTAYRYATRTGQILLREDSKQEILDDYVPVGASTFKVRSAADFKPGDRIVVHRPATAEWIHLIGCDQLTPRWAGIRDVRWVREGPAPGFYYQRLGYDSQYRILQEEGESWAEFQERIPLSEDGSRFDFTRQWKPEDYHFFFERRITGIEGNRITIDIPVVHPMERSYGGGAIYHYEIPGRITEVGIEYLRLVSEFAPPSPGHPYGDPELTAHAETHAWNGIHLKENTENTWVRYVTGNYFGWSLVSASGKRSTVQDCVNLGHASKIEGGRRYPFMVDGQLNLVQRCLTIEGRHEFVSQMKTAGPNVFVDCIGLESKSSAGPHHRYSVGTLFDNVKSEKPMESRFRDHSGTGHGWAGTQTCFYNCVAPEFLVQAPHGGISWVIGSGKENEEGIRVLPASLYYQQVKDRLGEAALDKLATEEQRKHLGEYRWVKERLGKAATQDINFTCLKIDTAGPQNPWAKFSGDLDQDGLSDIIIGGRRGPLVWYRYPEWTKHKIADGGYNTVDGEVADIDGDGDLDIVMGGMVWYENPGNLSAMPGQIWEMHRIADHPTHDIEIADLDNDHHLDVISRDQSEFASKSGNRIHVWMNRGKKPWKEMVLECPHGEGIVVKDLDEDGDADIVIGGIWYENTRSDGGIDFTAHPYADFHRNAAVQVGDINRDGRNDIVLTPSELAGSYHRISWFEAPADPRTIDWVEHVLLDSVECVVHSLALGDLNNDEAIDIAYAEMHQGADPDEVVILLNQKNGKSWKKQVISQKGSHGLRMDDVNDDGYPDLFGANHSSNHQPIELWLNQGTVR